MSEHIEEQYYDDDEPWVCWQCDGAGVVIACWDDICHGQGYCMHGDGMACCPSCNGSGELDERLKV